MRNLIPKQRVKYLVGHADRCDSSEGFPSNFCISKFREEAQKFLSRQQRCLDTWVNPQWLFIGGNGLSSVVGVIDRVSPVRSTLQQVVDFFSLADRSFSLSWSARATGQP